MSTNTAVIVLQEIRIYCLLMHNYLAWHNYCHFFAAAALQCSCQEEVLARGREVLARGREVIVPAVIMLQEFCCLEEKVVLQGESSASRK